MKLIQRRATASETFLSAACASSSSAANFGRAETSNHSTGAWIQCLELPSFKLLHFGFESTLPLGKPASNAPKYFVAVEVLALAEDREWLSQSKYWAQRPEEALGDGLGFGRRLTLAIHIVVSASSA